MHIPAELALRDYTPVESFRMGLRFVQTNDRRTVSTIITTLAKRACSSRLGLALSILFSDHIAINCSCETALTNYEQRSISL
jgi:hypothetical protein